MRNARARTRVLAKVTQRLRGIPTSRFAVNSLGIQMGGRQGFIPRLYKLTEVPLSDPHSTAVYTEAQLDKFMSKVTQRVGSGAKANLKIPWDITSIIMSHCIAKGILQI